MHQKQKRENEVISYYCKRRMVESLQYRCCKEYEMASYAKLLNVGIDTFKIDRKLIDDDGKPITKLRSFMQAITTTATITNIY